MGPATERDEKAVARFMERFAAALTEAGVPRMAARVFVALLCTDSGQVTAAELMETLLASAAAVAGAVRYLTQVGLIDREHQPGSRKDHYRRSCRRSFPPCLTAGANTRPVQPEAPSPGLREPSPFHP